MLHRLVAIAIVLIASIGPVASAQTVDEIIAKYVEARGGMDALQGVESAKYYGNSTMQGIEAPGVLYIKHPNKMRIELTIQGQTMIQAYDGESGWYISPFMGKTEPEKMGAEDAQELKEMGDFEGPMVNAKDKGNTVELLGKEDLEGSPVYKLKLTRENGDVDLVYLDAEHFLELKTTIKRTRQGAEVEVDNFSSDYKAVNGLMLAHSSENKMGGQTLMQYNIDSIQFNIDMPDSLFIMPEIKAAETDSTKTGE